MSSAATRVLVETHSHAVQAASEASALAAPVNCDALVHASRRMPAALAADLTGALGACMPLPLRQRPARAAPLAARDRWLQANLPAEVADGAPDFVQAMTRTRLHRHLAQRRETIIRDGVPGLWSEGAWTPWPTLQARYRFTQDCITDANGARCAYLQDGLRPWDSALWGPLGLDLPAQRRLPRDQCPTTPELHVLMADADEHAWCRLIDTEGRVFTFGAAIDAHAYKNYGPPLNTVVARVTSPDRNEASGRSADVRRIKLTDASFADVRAFVRRCAQAGLSFNWLNRNCNTFTAMVIERASGERPSTQASAQEYIMRHSILAPLFPAPLRAVVDVLVMVSTFGFNPVIQGATCLWGSDQASNPSGERYLENPLQLFSPLSFTDPDKLRDWIRGGQADSWRTTG